MTVGPLADGKLRELGRWSIEMFLLNSQMMKLVDYPSNRHDIPIRLNPAILAN